jgi:ADP-ribose pyrophosphatase
VPVLRATVLIDAPQRTVAGLLRDTEFATAALRRCGHRFSADVRLLANGDRADIAARIVPGIRVRMRTMIVAASEAGISSVRAAGPLPDLTHSVTLSSNQAGTFVLDEVRWTTPFGPLGRAADVVLLGRLVRRLLAARVDELVDRAAALLAGPVVVATAVHRDGRLLVAQRTRPPALAGRWELPGGRVEAGESEPDAVVRECREELAVAVRVTGRVGTDLPIDAGVLRVHAAELEIGTGEPQALEHAALRWVGRDDLPAVDWVDADRAVVPELVALLDEQTLRAAER